MVCQWHRNPEISLSSRNNPEMSQRSLDVPIVVKFSIYIYISMRSSLIWVVSFRLFWGEKNWYLIDIHCNLNSLKNRKCPNHLMFLQGDTASSALRLFYQTEWTIISHFCVSQLGQRLGAIPLSKVPSSTWHSLMPLMQNVRYGNMRLKFRKMTVCFLLPICLFVLHVLFILNREVNMSGSTAAVSKQRDNSDFRLINQFQMTHQTVRGS